MSYGPGHNEVPRPRIVLVGVALLSIWVVGAAAACSQPSPKPPAAPVDLPATTFDQHLKTDGGLPILQLSNFSGGEVLVVYDTALDDPIARWGQCLGRVTACARTNQGLLAGCVDLIERCADDSGGARCCPSRCIEEFKAALGRSGDEFAALEVSFLHGHCVAGFAEQTADLGLDLIGVSP